ncbi:MAG: FAD-dependent monooxygenase, partial [Hydrogenophaga sp.]
MHHDLIIIGAGPAGLSLARALRPSGLRIGLIEQAPRAALEKPAFDGREIALTQRSAQHLRRLGIWPFLDDT